MEKSSNSVSFPERISQYMTEAIAYDQMLNRMLESKDLSEELKILREQARCCFKALAQVRNSLEIINYDCGRLSSDAFDISACVEDICSVVKSKMRRSSIDITCEIEQGVKAVADTERFSACLMNLIVNALQNVDQEEGAVRITVKKIGRMAAVSVIDNGYGMSQLELSEKMSESGKGFEILRRFCDSVDTNPIFETTENGGFSVTVKVPLAPPSNTVEMRSGEIPPAYGPLSSGAILIYKLDDAIIAL